MLLEGISDRKRGLLGKPFPVAQFGKGIFPKQKLDTRGQSPAMRPA
jgi:hypothetical protein